MTAPCPNCRAEHPVDVDEYGRALLLCPRTPPGTVWLVSPMYRDEGDPGA